ncbi:hypothetical protein KEM48_004215, partial [Puccinia striiformis f. sp. tritici PST-130]
MSSPNRTLSEHIPSTLTDHYPPFRKSKLDRNYTNVVILFPFFDLTDQITLEPTLNKESIVLLGPNLFARLEPQTNLSTRHNDSIDLPNLLRTKITFSYPGRTSLDSNSNKKTNSSIKYSSIVSSESTKLTKNISKGKKSRNLTESPDAYQQKAEWLFSKRKKNRKKGTEEEDQYLAFVQLYGDDKEVLAKACKIVNSPAPETDLGTSGISGPTGNILLNAHVAKKKVDKLKKIVPLDISDTSTIESANSLFTTKPFKLTNLFPESLEEKPLAALNSTPKVIVTTKKDTSKSKLPVIDDSEDKLELAMDTNPRSTPDLTTQNQEERKQVEKPISPLKKDPEAVALPSAETTPELLSEEEEEEAPNEELIKTL